MRRYSYLLALAGVLLLAFGACRQERNLVPAEHEQIKVSAGLQAEAQGMYILNNGGPGTNKATLDYLDFATGDYARNIYAESNKELLPVLGDNAVDMALEGDRLFIVLAGSHKVVCLDAKTAHKLGEIMVNDCRSIAFHEGKGYVTSYKRKGLREDQAPLGEVVCFDPKTLKKTDSITVGMQPKAMLFGKSLLWVANCGEYNAPTYDASISLIDISGEKMAQLAKENVMKNIRLLLGSTNVTDGDYDMIYAYSDGDFHEMGPKLVEVDAKNLTPIEKTAHDYSLVAQALIPRKYVYMLRGTIVESGWYGRPAVTRYLQLGGSVKTAKEVELGPTQEEFVNALAFALSPTGDYMFISDAKNFTSSGVLYCYRTGDKAAFEWKVRAGIVPIKMVFKKK